MFLYVVCLFTLCVIVVYYFVVYLLYVVCNDRLSFISVSLFVFIFRIDRAAAKCVMVSS